LSQFCFVLLPFRVLKIHILIVLESDQGHHERRLLAHLGLFENNEGIGDGEMRNKLERPVFNESDALNVSFGLELQQIIDLVGIVSAKSIAYNQCRIKLFNVNFYY